jgi:hypothetical protein
MARTFKGKWALAILESERVPHRPSVALLYSMTKSQLVNIHPTAAASLMHVAASELAQELGVHYTSYPVTLHVKPFQWTADDVMTSAIVIEWSFQVVPPERDAAMTEIFSDLAADFMEHLDEEEYRHTIMVFDSEEETERAWCDPENEFVVCTKPDIGALKKNLCEGCPDQKVCGHRCEPPANAEPDPGVNAPPARGLN